jgi:hypothetical protein
MTLDSFKVADARLISHGGIECPDRVKGIEPSLILHPGLTLWPAAIPFPHESDAIPFALRGGLCDPAWSHENRLL